jgi:hypothetical protein
MRPTLLVLLSLLMLSLLCLCFFPLAAVAQCPACQKEKAPLVKDPPAIVAKPGCGCAVTGICSCPPGTCVCPACKQPPPAVVVALPVVACPGCCERPRVEWRPVVVIWGRNRHK